ncbi:helix-turn-helix domain-containing protein [Pseudofulvibacter geojedonensis]|uniref:Helix-turn-helix domain-containing protein n=1 Tax=Pseudofulvibacter geojedonensis TaxID=1123758 RepID=A0ABW3I1V9_9FLAO
MSFGAHLKKIRKGNKVTQEELANAIGKHVTQIKRYESGSSEPNVTTFYEISKALNVSIEELLSYSTNQDSEIDSKLKESFKKLLELPENKKFSILDLLEAFINQNKK